jgi:hypothetical protein
MTSAIVLLPLTFWAKNHLSSVLKATTPAAFNAAFDAFVAHDATAVINGAHVSREELKQKWQEQAFDEAGATVDFTGDVEVSAEKDGSVLVSGVPPRTMCSGS